jgi:hypothetical protein
MTLAMKRMVGIACRWSNRNAISSIATHRSVRITPRITCEGRACDPHRSGPCQLHPVVRRHPLQESPLSPIGGACSTASRRCPRAAAPMATEAQNALWLPMSATCNSGPPGKELPKTRTAKNPTNHMNDMRTATRRRGSLIATMGLRRKRPADCLSASKIVATPATAPTSAAVTSAAQPVPNSAQLPKPSTPPTTAATPRSSHQRSTHGLFTRPPASTPPLPWPSNTWMSCGAARGVVTARRRQLHPIVIRRPISLDSTPRLRPRERPKERRG